MTALDIDAFWEYSDPAQSEARFRAALGTATPEQQLELLTQIARSYSLRQRFAEAHALLDQVAQQADGMHPQVYTRYLLERGRTINASGDQAAARELFTRAWEAARAAQLDGLAVDAAHMVAITHAGTAAAIPWHQRGLELARGSQDAKAQALIPALLNNGAWDLHDQGQCTEALTWFEQAEAEWRARQQPVQLQIARWSVARCLRSLGRYADALAIQQSLAAEHQAAGTVDGYVFEELGENLRALGRHDEAQPYFALAAAERLRDGV